jgi:hypothetical protein
MVLKNTATVIGKKVSLFTVTSIAESDIISNSSGEMMTNRMVEPLYGTYLELSGLSKTSQR